MNIISLFDGISCGRVALERANIKVDNYYAFEIDKFAIKCAVANHPTNQNLYDVRYATEFNLENIDLLIGGSPCIGFSQAGKGLNFKDEQSKLFFEYAKCLEYYNPKYFLLENVSMKKEYQDIISGYLGVKPIVINSSLVSAQNRKRLYWTNIPNIVQPNDRHIYFNDYLYQLGHGFIKDDIVFKSKYPTLVGQSPASKYRIITNIDEASKVPILELRSNKKLTRIISPLECERLQTLPDNYTNILSNTQRYKTLGNGWTVDVIAHILGFIK